MRKITYLFALLLITLSCEQENYIQYDTSLKDAVYIDLTPETDSIFYNFGFESITKDTLFVDVKLTGIPRGEDRVINITTDNSRYASEEFAAAKDSYFTIPETVILPKDSIKTQIPIILHRDLELETARAILTLELVANEHFEVRGHKEYTVTFDDMLPAAPAWWRYSTYKYGGFTKVKYQLYLQFFWATEETDPYFYNKIVEKFGRELNLRTSPFDNPSNDYPIFIETNIHIPLFEYQEANPGVIEGVVDPRD